jgi:tRNA pseudouridine38-40 synthase
VAKLELLSNPPRADAFTFMGASLDKKQQMDPVDITHTQSTMAEDAPAQAPVSAPAAVPTPAAAAAPAVTVKSEANDTTPAAPVKRERDDAAASEEAAMNAGSSEAGAKRGRFDRKGNHGGPRKDGAKGHWQQKKEERKAKGREHGRRGKPWEKKPKGPVDEEEAANAGSARPVKAEGEEGDGERRLPKKRAAVLVGYCGTGYSGMQMYVTTDGLFGKGVGG